MKKALPTMNKYLKKIKEEYRKSFTVSFGVFAVALIFLFIFISRSVSSFSQEKETEANLLIKKIEYRHSLINTKENVGKELENLEKNWLSMKSKIFLDSLDEVTFSSILKTIEDLSEKRKVTIKSYRLEEVKKVGNFSVLPVTFELSITYKNLVSLLYAIENHKNYLKISNITIRSVSQREDMVVQMFIEGYRYYEEVK